LHGGIALASSGMTGPSFQAGPPSPTLIDRQSSSCNALPRRAEDHRGAEGGKATRRIGGAGGGSDKGSSGAGTFLVAAGIALVLAAGGTTAVGSGVIGSGTSVSASGSAGVRGLPDESSARDLHRLLDTDRTGNVTELSRERGRYRSVRFTGDFYASRREGTVVVNAQAQPVARGGAGLALTSVVTNAVQ
jgi:hypothetical protein